MPNEKGPSFQQTISKKSSEIEISGGGAVAVQKAQEEQTHILGKVERDELVLKYMPLVKSIAIRIKRTLPEHVDLDDLIHIGTIGLLEAVKKLNPKKAFGAYARTIIRGRILDSLRKLDWASRDTRRWLKKIEKVTINLESKLQRKPSEEEIAKALGMTLDKFRLKMVDIKKIILIPSTSIKEGEEEYDLIQSNINDKSHEQPDHIFLNEQLRSTLAEVMKTLPKRYQKILTLYYVEGKAMKEIGRVLGIGESRVSQIHKTALEKLNVSLKQKGINSSADFGLEVLLKNKGHYRANSKAIGT